MLEQLKLDYKQSIKDKDNIKKNVIQMIRANIINLAKDKNVLDTELTKEDILGVIQRELKQQNDTLEASKVAGRSGLVAEAQRSIDILMNYLPRQLDESEIRNEINKAMSELGFTNLEGKNQGRLMRTLMTRLKGRADGRLVNSIVSKMT